MQPRKFIPLEFLTQAQIRSVRVRAAKDRGTHSEQEWLEVIAECEGKCVSCGDDGPIEKDHAIPVAYEGSTEAIWNIQPLCRKCNASKKDASIRNWRMEKRIEQKLDAGEKAWLFTMIDHALQAEQTKASLDGWNPPDVEPKFVSEHVMSYIVDAAVAEMGRIRKDNVIPEGFEEKKLRSLADFLQEYHPMDAHSWAEAFNLPQSPDEIMTKLMPEWVNMPEEDRIKIMLDLRKGLSHVHDI